MKLMIFRTIIPLLLLWIHLCAAFPVGGEEVQTQTQDQKSKLTAFLLSLFLGSFGADWFYLSLGYFSYVIVGIIKLILMLVGGRIRPCCCICACSCEVEGNEGLANTQNIIRVVSFVWWVLDWVRILANIFPDGSGMPLIADF